MSDRVYLNVLALLAATPAALAHDGEMEVHIGRNAAGQLVATVEFEQPGVIEASVFPQFPGYATGLIGFHSALEDEPDEDIYVMNDTASIRGIFIGSDPGFHVFNGPNFMGPGDVMEFGSPFFDYHPLFNIYDGHVGQSYEMRMYLHDDSGQYADSEGIVISFTPEPDFGDLNGDGFIDGADLGLLLLDFGPCDGCAGDLDESGEVDGGDIGLLLLSYT